jgi:uncharacterized protein YcfJ
MKIATLALALAAAGTFAMPAVGQTRAEQARWDAAQRRFENERAIYQHERELYDNAVARGRDGYRDGGDPYATDYDAARYYRDDPRYQERTLGPDDYVYRGSDGRYYCRRSDGTTGLIVGAAAGGILGNVIDGGRHRTGGTLIGGALGALLGRSVEQNSQEMRCR